MGPTRIESLGGKRYIMVIVDDFSRYTWVESLREKSEACEKLEIFCKKLQNEKAAPIVKVRSDHGKEFENARFESFCVKKWNQKGIFSPQNSSTKWNGREKKSGDSRNDKSYATKQANTSKVLGRSREHLMSHWQ